MEQLEDFRREELIEVIIELRRVNLRLQAEIQELKRRGGAAPVSKGKPDPKPPGRKPGQGFFRFRSGPAEVREAISVIVAERCCPDCGGAMGSVRREMVSTTDVPAQPKPKTRCYAVEVRQCRQCGGKVRRRHPDIARGQHGAPRSCTVTTQPGPPAQASFALSDSGSGFGSVVLVDAVNASKNIPAFSSGITSLVTAKAAQVNASQASKVDLQLTNVAGETPTCGITFSAGPGWTSIAGSLNSKIALSSNSDGRIQAFVRGTDKALWTISQIAPSGAWSAWSSLGVLSWAIRQLPPTGMDAWKSSRWVATIPFGTSPRLRLAPRSPAGPGSETLWPVTRRGGQPGRPA